MIFPIQDRIARNKEEFADILNILATRIAPVPFEEFRLFLDEARRISPDPDDSVYFALALRLEAAIWSNDKRLKEQNLVHSTSDLLLLDILK